MALIRLAYASEATFSASPLEQGVEPHVARILMASRKNNPRRGLVGGLYYGDNRFFQYLEGEEQAVYDLYETIKRDERHRNVKLLIDEPASERTFSNWSMKYVPTAEDVVGFLEKQKMKDFNPYAFDRDMCEEMIKLIRESSHDDKLVNYSAESRPNQSAASPAGVSAGSRNGLVLAGIVLATAIVAAGFVIL
jgi:hypothetical protein